MSDDGRLLLVDTFAPAARASAMTPPRQLLSQKEMNRYIMTQLRNNNLANFQSSDATASQPISAASPFASSNDPSATTPAGGTTALPVVASLANLKTKSHVLSLVARAGLEVNRSVAVRSGLFSMLVLQRKQTHRIPEPAPVPEPQSQPPPPEREIVSPPEQRGSEEEKSVNELVDEKQFGNADRQPHEQRETDLPSEHENNRAGNSFELRSEEQRLDNENQRPNEERERDASSPHHSDHGSTQEDNSAEPQVESHGTENQRDELHQNSQENHVTEPLGLGHIHDMPESEKDLLNVLGSLGSHQQEEQQQFQLFEQHVSGAQGESGECLAGDSSCQQQPHEVNNNDDNSLHQHARKRFDPDDHEQQARTEPHSEDTVPTIETETVNSNDDHQLPFHSVSDVTATSSPPEDQSARSQEQEPARQPEPIPQPQETVHEAQKESPPTGNFFSNFWNPAQPPPPEPQRPPQETEAAQDEHVQQQQEDVPRERAQEEQNQNQQQHNDLSHQHFQHDDEQIHRVQHEQPGGGDDDRYEPPETEPEYPPHEYDTTQPAADATAHHGNSLNQDSQADNQPFFPAPQLHDDLHDVPVEPIN